MKISIPKDGRDLCCYVNPIMGEESDVTMRGFCWCCYCGNNICIECLDSYLVDEYHHHKKCKTACPHTEEFHHDD